MTLTDETAAGQGDALSFVFDLRHAPEKVWRALTDPALLSAWLLPIAALELRPGAAFAFTAPPQPGWDGIVRCRLLASDPPRSLSSTWVVGDLDTVVTFTLAPAGSGTRLALVHAGFKPSQKQNFGGARHGWKLMGGKLVDLLARQP